MRILQISSARQRGGGEKHLADLANSMARRGHNVFAALAPSSPLLGELPAVPKQNIAELRIRNSLNVSSALKLARFVREHQIEIIHAHVARDYPLAAFVSRRSDAQLVLTRHVLFPMSAIHRLTLRRTALVIAVSQAVADGLREQGIFAPDKITLIHNGIDVDRFVRAARAARGSEAAGREESPGKRLRVGMVGHLAPIKGQEDFIRAAAIVRGLRDDVDFVIAGEDKSPRGEHRQSIERLIVELDLNQSVRLSGWVDDIAELLPTFDLFVSPSRSEPFGLSIVEAMAAGTPVIASMSEGAREIIDDNNTGRLVPIGDVHTLAKVIGELLADPAQRGDLSAKAQRVVGERFSLERMVEETERVYEQVLGRA
jgi:glycosyltransferase involved in cell wall biosynthesis